MRIILNFSLLLNCIANDAASLFVVSGCSQSGDEV